MAARDPARGRIASIRSSPTGLVFVERIARVTGEARALIWPGRPQAQPRELRLADPLPGRSPAVPVERTADYLSGSSIHCD
jgi:hypothetical protein